jgi:hypothetical protein
MKNRWLLVLFIIGFIAMVAYRAAVIPITHDEASTWFNFRHYNLWGCLTDYWCWQTANNHWLNSLFLQWSAGIFGESPFALRLPNVLAGGLYFFAGALLSWRYIKTMMLQLAGFLLLCGHVYLLDFFSLARGYGLMACGVLWGVYFFLRYIEQYEIRWLVCSVLSMVFAVLSNFTALLPLSSLGLGWLVLILGQKKFSFLFRHGYVWAIASAVLAGLLYFPIRMLRASGEFEWGAADLYDTLRDLFWNLLYGAQYFGAKSPDVLLWIFFFLILMVVIVTLLTRQFNSKPQMTGVLLLFGLNLAGIVFLAYFLGSQAPIGRKSIYLIPLLFAPLALGLNLIKNKYAGLVLGVLISGSTLYHAYERCIPAASREWYYDAYYPGLFSAILPVEAPADSIRLGSSWIFNPALTFYQTTQSLPLSGLAYQKPLVVDSTMEYYYVEYPDTIGMCSVGFILDKMIGPYYLYKKSDASPLLHQVK